MKQRKTGKSFTEAEKLHKPRAINGGQKPLVSDLSITFVLCTTFILIGFFRKVILGTVTHFWFESGNFWQSKWDSVLDTIGEDDFTLWIWGTLAVGTSTYWILGSFYVILDVTLKPAILRQYKVQPGTNEPVDLKKLMKVIGVVLFNQLVVSLVFGLIMIKIQQWIGFPPIRELPSFHKIILDLAAFIIVFEIGFYYAHRLLHHRFFYRRFHKQHHEWTSPIAVTAIYCHFLEHMLSNLLPVYAGPLLMGSHITTSWLWTIITIISTLNAHSGYHFPFYLSSEQHDFHHLKFTQCYGVLGLLDRLHKTNELFHSTGVSTRNVMLRSLTPARVAYPLPSDAASI